MLVVPVPYLAASAWTGEDDLHIEGKYVWDDSNISVAFTNFTILEPSLGNIGDCFDILRNGEVNDRFCSDLVSFICKKETSFYLSIMVNNTKRLDILSRNGL